MTAPLAPPEIRFTKTTLANGLDVIARRQPHLPVVAVNLWYHVGSKNEERRQRGFAHLFEHLMFEGSEHYPGDFFKPLQRLGAGVNGSTSTDRTNYYEDIPAAHVELAVAMESDRMANLLPALDERKLRVQKDVVKNEYRQNYANRPYGQVWRLLAEALYPPEHPYSWLTIGVMEDVEAATRDDVEAFFRRFYVPSNASLCLVGDIDEDRALALAERYFGGIPGGAPAVRPRSPEVALPGDVEVTLRDRVELDRLYRLWPTVPHFHPDDAPLALLADVLARGKASRLYRRLVMEEQVAQDVTAYQGSRELAGTYGLIATARPGRELARAREVAEAELADLAARGPTDEELARARNGRLASHIYALDNIGGFGGVADRLNAYNTYLGDPGHFADDARRYLEATADDLRRVAARYLAGRPSVGLAVLGRARSAAAPLDRATPPAPAPAVPFRAPDPEVRRLACGAELWVIPRRDLPIVAATAVVDAGASTHGPDRGGLASLAASLLDEGTARFSSLDLALAAERLGTNLGTSCGWDGAYVSLQCLSPHLDESLDLAAEVLVAPTFPPEEFARVHGQTLAAIRADDDRAEAVASRVLLRQLYPDGHPYRVPTEGLESTASGLGRDEVAAFYARRFRPRGAAWVVAGDVDPDALARRLDDLLAPWSPGEPASAEPWPEVPASRARLILVDRPGAPQAVVRVGHVGIRRLDPDHDHLAVFNQVLGGQFTSRLNERLREEKGYTYGVRSHFDARRGAGPFTIGASLESARLADALEDLRAEVAALLDHRPPTPAELDDARRALIEGQARHFETPSALVARYAGLFLHGLPPDHHARLAARLGAVTIGSMIDAARRHLRPSELVFVVVADAEAVAPGLARLPWASLERA
jgi:predicted Zn-dependent peptidase